MRKSSTAWVLIGYLILRWILAAQPGYTYDVLAYKRWAMAAADFGISGVYENSDCDYPPLYAYYLYPMGKIYQILSPDEFAIRQDSPLLTFLVKFPPLVMDLATAWLLYRFSLWVRAGGWKRRREESAAAADERAPPVSRWVLWIPFLYLFNPAVLFDGAYWGQPDAIHSFFVLAAFVCMGWSNRAWLPWVLLALGTLMKPLGAPFFPLLAVLSIARFGWGRSIVGVFAAAVTTTIVFLPFLLAGNMDTTLDRVVGDVTLFPHTSTNAHNFWWLMGPWQNSEVPWLGPITATQFSLLLFGMFYLAILIKGHRLHRADEDGITHPQMLGLAFLVGFGFFMLATHMHENHMYITIPLALPLLLWTGRTSRRFRYIFVAVTVGTLLNMALHDLHLPNLPPLNWGGDSAVQNLHMKRPFPVFQLWAIRFSLGWNLVLFAIVLGTALKPRGWLDRTD